MANVVAIHTFVPHTNGIVKLSISLSPKIGKNLRQLVEIHNSNPSAVVETALRLFGGLDRVVRERATRETHDSKRVPSAASWRENFWRLVAEEFDADETPYAPMGPRTYGKGRCSIVFLLSDVRNSDPDALIVHVMTQVSSGVSDGVTWTHQYAVDSSVYQAARDVAGWIRDYDVARDKFSEFLDLARRSGRFLNMLTDGRAVLRHDSGPNLVMGVQVNSERSPRLAIQEVVGGSLQDVSRTAAGQFETYLAR